MRSRMDPFRFIRVFLAIAALIACAAGADAGGGTRHYVTQAGGGSRNGDGWANAYGEAEFPAAIRSADAGDEFWVAKGAYRPAIPAGAPTSDDVKAAFVLKDGVALYGGFAGAETASADRNPQANVTVLTGDLTNDDADKANGVTLSADRIVGTNSLCVVRTSDDIGAATVLDGFTVTAAKFVEDEKGSAGWRNVPDGRTKEIGDAAGMINSGGSPTVNGCVFAGNAGLKGGGMSTSDGSPTVTHCVFSGNTAVEDGGGMSTSEGSPTVTHCVFSGNTAMFGAGMRASDSDGLKIANCTFSGNTAVYSGGGVYSHGCSLSLTDCVFTGNGAGTAGKLSNGAQPRGTAGRLGGGMYATDGAPKVTGCSFSGNDAADDGGGMFVQGNADDDDGGMRLKDDSYPTVEDCVFSGNTAENGGGLAAIDDSDPLVSRCVFSGNEATFHGGGMYDDDSDPTVTDCTFSGNTAGYGGGMATGESGGRALVTRCTFSGNTAVGIEPKVGGGGGMNTAGDPRVWNCTFSGNAAPEGGGIFNNADGLLLLFCTFSGNTADSGGGLYNYEADDADDKGPLVENCIFWGNPGGEIYNDATHPDVDYCVIRSADSTGKADSSKVIITDDPLLGSLAWNGGATQTFALRPGSSAIDAGAPFTGKTGRAKGVVISDDQRGVSRDVSPDIGAYEYWERKILTVHVDGAGSVDVNPAGDAVGPTGDCRSYVAGTSVTLTASPDAGSMFVAWSGDVSGASATTTITVSPDRYARAVFATQWIIAASAGAGGTIAPSGNVSVPDGADQTFTVTPNAGYEIASVVVDGVPVGAVTTHTFTDVRADHTIAASFGPAPTAAPTATPTPAPSLTPTPTTVPYPTPDPDIPLPTVTLKLTLLSGGVIVLGPVDITDPDAIASLLSSAALWAQLLETDPDAILSGDFNMDLVKFFSLLSKLDAGVTDLTLLLEVTIDGTPSGYGSQVFLLMRTFDSDGKPTGYVVVPQNEGATVFRKRAGAETWRVSVSDGSSTDGDGKVNGYVAPQIAAVVAVFPLAVTVTPTAGSTGSGGGCSAAASPGSASGAIAMALLFLAPVALVRRR